MKWKAEESSFCVSTLFNKSVWSIHYRLKNRESLENYFREHAQRMRQEGLRRFAGKFSAHRRILLQKENLAAEA